MAIQTFTAGQILTAADTNTYLANSGLVYVTSVAITGTPVTFVDVTSCFSSTYDNYRITYTAKGNGSAAFHTLTLYNGGTPTATGYYQNGTSMTSNSTTVGGIAQANGASFSLGAQQAGTDPFYGSIEMMRPFEATQTYMQVTTSTYAAGFGYNYTLQGVQNGTTSFTGFRITTPAGSFNTGTVTVYGYRKA